MIVTCDQCGQRARIKAEKLPPQGGKIRCPQCSNVIIVKPPGGAPPPSGDTTAVAPKPKPPETQAPEPAAKPEPPPVAKTPDAPPPPEPSADAAAVEAATWKLRVSGLTYSFQTLDSLQQWLNGRDSLAGIRVARNTDDWHELGDYPEVLTEQLQIRFFPDGELPTTSSVANKAATAPASEGESKPTIEPARPNPARKSSSDMGRRNANRARQTGRPTGGNPRRRGKKGGKASAASSKTGLYLGILVALIATAAGLHFAGLIDLGFILPTSQEQEELIDAKPGAKPDATAATTAATAETTARAVTTAPPVDAVDPEEEARLEAEIAAEQLAKLEESLARATELMDGKRWAEARAVLEQQAKLWPDRLDVNSALLTVYEKLGKREEAEAQRTIVEALEARDEAAGDGEEDEDESSN